MTNFDIKINKLFLDNNSLRLGTKSNNKLVDKLYYSFAEYVLNFYKLSIKESIYSNRYRGEWEPKKNLNYIEYIGTIPKCNIFDLIEESFSVKKIGYSYLITFDINKKYPGSKFSIFRVVKSLEYGTSKFRSRPLLMRIKRDIDRNLISMWRGYLAMKGLM